MLVHVAKIFQEARTVKLADLLKGEILGLVDEEVNENQRYPTEAAPDPEDVRLKISIVFTGHVRCHES